MELGEVIQNDAVVMSKVIGAANTLFYNPNAVPVSSIIQAIHVIGYERIRSLAMSLMLAEQASRGQSAEEQREIAAQALVAGCLAQSIADNRALLDKEQAFVCGCLRSFGHVVMASCMFEEYKQARELTGNLPDDEAYRSVFGLTPLELGHHLLKAANLPEEILVTLRALPAEAIAVLETKPGEQMRALTECAERLAKLTCDAKVTPEIFADRAAALAQDYEKILPHLGDAVPGVMQAATQQMDYLVRTFRMRSLPVRTLSRMRSCRNAVDPARVVPPANIAATEAASRPIPAPAGGAPATTAPPELPAAAARAQPVEAVVVALLPEQPRGPAALPLNSGPASSQSLAALALPAHDWQESINGLAGMLRETGVTQDKLQQALIEGICAGLGAPDGLLFSSVAQRQGFCLTQGRGRLHARFKEKPEMVVQPGDRTVFGVCLQRNENINIHHAHEPRITAYLPSWLKGQDDLGAFVLLPLTDGVQKQGVVLVGWPGACQITLPPACVRSLRTMIAFVCKARMRLAA